MLLLRASTRLRFFTTTSESIHSSPKLGFFCRSGNLEEALSLFYSRSVPHTPQTYSALFKACAHHNRFHQALALHHHMLTHNPDVRPDLFVTNHLINMYAKCGRLHEAHRLFDEMIQRNVVSWTALISGYAQHGRPEECFSLFSAMLPHYSPTDFAYASVLACCDGVCGRQLHALALKTSSDAYVFVANALITMYSKSCEFGVYDDEKDEAWKVFQGMEFHNLITWNSMIAGFQIRGLIAQVISLFSLMYLDGHYDRPTLLSVFLSLCGIIADDFEWGLRCSFQLHCLTIKSGFILDIGVTTALVKAYSVLGGDVTDCRKLFEETSGRRDVVSWTGIITAFAERDPEEALFLFRQLRREGLSPDLYTFSCVLKACAGFMTERHASAIHSQVFKAGFEDDSVLANTLIHAYARSGSISLSKQVFNEMGYRGTVSWNSMLKAFALHGQAQQALQLFSGMNIEPDAITFVALLSACSHAGLVKEGTRIFDAMSEKYGIAPQVDHFGCMVDILGRAGRVLEAEKLIKNMPMEPDYVVWSALLGACRKHGETTGLANVAASKLKELNPENSLGYVVMSNMYCFAGSFDEAGLMRKEMKGLGVKKAPGLSWIEIGNRVHEFAAGGQRHPRGGEIRENLEELIQELKKIGYVPETSLALHDVEEEHKEEQLYYHSEKLALVFALMNEEGQKLQHQAIKIMKNIRICVDCHNFMKFVSGLVQREIVVRDSNRFHHFKEGACSCNDYW